MRLYVNNQLIIDDFSPRHTSIRPSRRLHSLCQYRKDSSAGVALRMTCDSRLRILGATVCLVLVPAEWSAGELGFATTSADTQRL